MWQNLLAKATKSGVRVICQPSNFHFCMGWYRTSKIVILWHELLLLLEGEPVHLSARKTHYAQDILLTSDTPIFATSSFEILFIKHGVICDTDTEMMKVRWKVFKFHHRISESQQRSIWPCGRCFAQLVLQEQQTFRKYIIMKFVLFCFILFCSTIKPHSRD